MYLVHKESSDGMRISGTTAWGEVWSVITAPSGDPIGVDALYVGFFVSEVDANNIASTLGRIAELEAQLTTMEENFQAVRRDRDELEQELLGLKHWQPA